MEWISVEEVMPPTNTQVLLLYKHEKSRWNGTNGRFITQGVLRPNYRNTAYEFKDYLERQIQALDAKASKNQVTHWQHLLEMPV